VNKKIIGLLLASILMLTVIGLSGCTDTARDVGGSTLDAIDEGTYKYGYKEGYEDGALDKARGNNEDYTRNWKSELPGSDDWNKGYKERYIDAYRGYEENDDPAAYNTRP